MAVEWQKVSIVDIMNLILIQFWCFVLFFLSHCFIFVLLLLQLRLCNYKSILFLIFSENVRSGTLFLIWMPIQKYLFNSSHKNFPYKRSEMLKQCNLIHSKSNEKESLNGLYSRVLTMSRHFSRFRHSKTPAPTDDLEVFIRDC